MKEGTRQSDKAPKGKKRDPHWAEDRAGWLKDHGTCAVCGGHQKLEVHHIQPFHDHPERERDPTNWITLCENKKDGINCHLAFGHLGNFKSYNVSVVADSSEWNKKILNRPK